MPIRSEHPRDRVDPSCRRPWVRAVARLCFSLLALAAGSALALDPHAAFEQYRFDAWGTDAGLPQISASTITQDRVGYLWVGTQNGIARFDGANFTVFDHDHGGVDTTLPSSSLATSDGKVWFGTPRGVLWIGDGSIHAIASDGPLVAILDLAQDESGRLLAASESGLYAVDGARLRREPTMHGPAYGMTRDGSAVWVGSRGAIVRLEEGHATRIALPDADLKVRQIVREGDRLWLGTPAGLKEMTLPDHALADVPAAAGEAIESLRMDGDGNLWVGSVEHLRRRYPDGRWETVATQDLFAHPWIVAIFEDREGSLWLGSRTQSLVRLRNSAVSRIGARQGMTDPFVWSLLRQPDGTLLLGTNHGLAGVGADGSLQAPPTAALLGNAQIYSLDPDPDGGVWIGTRGAGLHLLRDGTVTTPPALAALAGADITAVQPAGRGQRWIATLDGLFRDDGTRLQAVGPHDGSPAAKMRTLLPQADGSALAGTEAGIFRVDGDRLTRLPGTRALDAAFVTRLAWLKPGLLAIATMDHGLGVWRNGHLRLLGKPEGLPSNNGWTLDVVGDYLYVASIDGVYRLAVRDLPDPAAPATTAHLRSQIVIEGSQRGSGGRRYGCCNGGGDGRSLREGNILWFASSAGAVRLDTAALPPPLAPPAALVEKASNGGSEYSGQAPIRLDASNRDIDIRYTGLSLVDSARLEFRYRLDGYDRHWRDAGTRRVAYYTHLPPGTFAFHVQARAPFGDWGADVTPLSIEVVPHWYERWSVRLAGLAVLLLLAGAGVFRHNTALRRRARELQRAVDARTAELATLNSRLQRLSRTDSLTGLANRRAFDDAAVAGTGERRGAVLLIDLDHFKRINDEFGHGRGDEVLVALGEILRASTRSDDHVLRWGGEEFLIVSHRLDVETALLLAERIRDALASRHFRGHDEHALGVTCSVGIASLPIHPQRTGDLEAAIALADFALYRAKHAGRDRACAALIPADAAIPPSGDLRNVIERLDALGRLHWRNAGDTHAA